MANQNLENCGRKVHNLDSVLQSVRTTVVERGGNNGFMSSGPLAPKVQKQIDVLIDKFRKYVDLATVVYYTLGANYEDGGDIAAFLSQASILGRAGNTVVDALVKEWSGRNVGDVQRADILTANYKYNDKIGLYLRYVEQTSICTATRDTFFDLGAVVNPPNLKEIAEKGSPNRIKLSGEHLNLYQDGSMDPNLKVDEAIKRVYDNGIITQG